MNADRFPWKIFWKYFVVILASFNLLTLAIVSLEDLRYQIRPFVFNELLLNFFVGAVVVAAVISYFLVLPYKRVTSKALKVLNKRIYGNLVEDEHADNLLVDDARDVSDLEIILDKIHRKMKHRKARFLRSQEENRAFIDSITEGVVRIGLDEKIIFYNEKFAAQFLPTDFLNKDNLTLKQVIRNSDILEGFEQVIKTARPQRYAVRLAAIGDVPRYFSVSITPIKNENTGEMYGVIGVFHDISDLKKAEQIRIDFVANASHELRTPLTSVKGYVDTLREDVKTGELRDAGKFLDIISNNVDRLMDLVNDMLTINSLEYSSQDLKWEVVNPLAISEQIVSELSVLADAKNISMYIEGDAPHFLADGIKVEQVLRNLVSNAIKYIPEGKTIKIKWERDIKEYVILRVIDNGPGIPEVHLDRLFERFYRIDRGRSRDSGGTGLGLAIIKHIMHSHGGTVAVKSIVNEGTEFICSFPIRK